MKVKNIMFAGFAAAIFASVAGAANAAATYELASKQYVDAEIETLGVDVNSKVDHKQGVENAGKGMVVDDQGVLVLTDVATDAELNTLAQSQGERIMNLNNTVSAMDTAYKAADEGLSQQISAMDTAYKAADAALGERVEQLTSGGATKDDLQQAIEAEATRADTEAQKKVDALAQSQGERITNLNNTVSAMDTAYKAADEGLSQQISAMDTAYKAADEGLSQQISAMDTAYKAADAGLQNSIDGKQAQLTGTANTVAFVKMDAQGKVTETIGSIAVIGAGGEDLLTK